MRIRYTGPAYRDLASLLDYTEQHWPQNVEAVLSRIEEIERLLTRFPMMGPPTTRRSVRRYSLKPLPFVLFYRVTASEIEVVRIHHAARRTSDPVGP